MKRLLFILFVVVMFSNLVYAQQYIPEQLMVKYKTAPRTLAKIASTDMVQDNMYRINLPAGADVDKIMAEYENDENVEFVLPNMLIPVHRQPNDELFHYWQKNYEHSAIDLERAWNITIGSEEIVIAVIDMGVNISHPDLKDNIWTNEDEIPNNNIDDDNNGYIDDVHGWDFVEVPPEYAYPGEDYSVPDNDPTDFSGHGTAVAGVVAAVTDNHEGVAGVCWNCKIMPLRIGVVLANGGETMLFYEQYDAIKYAVENGADIISMSYGVNLTDDDYYLQIKHDYIKLGYDNGLVMVASAGNDDSDHKSYPAAFPEVISVAALDNFNEKASFSNYGDWVDIAAPGQNIMALGQGRIKERNGDYYAYLMGTSFSAPMVAATAGLMLSENDYSNDEVKTILLETSDDLYSVWEMGGKLNAYNALLYELEFDLEDVNEDGKVNILDLSTIAKDFGGTTYDINNDGSVNVLDLVMVAKKII